MVYGRERSILGTSEGRKLEEFMFSELVLKNGIQTLKDTRYALKDKKSPQSKLRPNTNTCIFQEVGKVCL